LLLNGIKCVQKQHGVQKPVKVTLCHPFQNGFKSTYPSIQLLTSLFGKYLVFIVPL
jgi:hypothetical protein